MARTEETNDGSEYVTKSDLREMLAEILGSGDEGGDDDGGWETIEDAIDDGWEIVEDLGENIRDSFSGSDNVSSSDIEKIAEQKVQEALRKLAGVKKPAAAAKKAAPKKAKPEPEVEPTVKKRGRFGASFWGAE